MLKRLMARLFSSGSTVVDVSNTGETTKQIWWEEKQHINADQNDAYRNGAKNSEIQSSLGHREHKQVPSNTENSFDPEVNMESPLVSKPKVAHLPDKAVPVAELSGEERQYLIRLMGFDYVASTRFVTMEQRSIIRSIVGFEWMPKELEYWKSEYINSDSWRLGGRGESLNKGEPVKSRSEPSIELNNEQKRVFDYIENTSENLFITGRAGAGKSFLLQHLIQHSAKRILPVAYMGVAALNIGGSTIHSAFKLPLTLLTPSTGMLIAEGLSEHEREYYREFQLLLIDEISMVAADMFVAMDEFFRSIKGTDAAFGGLQVIAFGDPYQLPPIVDRNSGPEFYADIWGGPYFFCTNSWTEGEFHKVELQGSERQQNSQFLKVLDSIRVGRISDSDLKLINSRVVPDTEIPKHGAIRLSATNLNADKFNALRLDQLSGDMFTYVGEASGDYRKNWNRLPAPMTLHLKRQAQVIMVKNDPTRRWVNGSMGIISDIDQDRIIVEIEEVEYEVEQVTWDKKSHSYDVSSGTLTPGSISEYKQYPIDLGWARTIHKSQGQTFDQCVVDLSSKMFENGQAYVALSRTKELDGLFLTRPLPARDIRTSEPVRRFMSDLESPMALPNF